MPISLPTRFTSSFSWNGIPLLSGYKNELAVFGRNNNKHTGSSSATWDTNYKGRRRSSKKRAAAKREWAVLGVV